MFYSEQKFNNDLVKSSAPYKLIQRQPIDFEDSHRIHSRKHQHTDPIHIIQRALESSPKIKLV